MTAHAPDLALIDAAIERAREVTMRRLREGRKSPAWYRRLAAGKIKPPRPWKPREERRWAVTERTFRRDDVTERRRRMAEQPVRVPWGDQVSAYYDALYASAESRAQAEVRYAGIRELVASALDRVADWARTADSPTSPGEFRLMAEKLRRARREGYWGVNIDTNKVTVRLCDRSGLTILDPSEARERQAELVARLVPELLRLKAAGFLLYYAVASEPNVPAGRLAWGKRHLYERFRRAILGRQADGRAARDGGAFPEIVGAFAVQEDPLAADGMKWNVHLNAILVVDPRQCTRLDADLVQQLQLRLRGPVEKLPERPAVDRTPPGLLSYDKVHHVWGSDQFELDLIKASDPVALGKRILEVVKYSAKWVSAKQLGELPGAAATSELKELPPLIESVEIAPASYEMDGARHRGRCRPPTHGDILTGNHYPQGGVPVVNPQGTGETDIGSACAPLSRATAAAVTPAAGAAAGSAGEAFALDGGRRRGRGRPAAPGVTQWPEARVAEWIEANRRFRRVRGHGALYRLAARVLPPDPDDASRIRWLGRVFISPRGAVVHAAAVEYVGLTHGDNSGRDFSGQPARSTGARAREGPDRAA